MAELTTEQREEFARCAKDFSHFAENYLQVAHWKHGLLPFKLYPWQKRLADAFDNNRFTICKNFRQGGFTTLIAGYMFWRSMFKNDESLMFNIKTDREACCVSNIVETFVKYLPDWLQPEFGKRNDHFKHITDTNSKLYFYTPEAACGKAISYLFVDQAAFIPRMDAHWKAMYPTLSTGGRCAVLSTPNGKGNWFYQTYCDAVNCKNLFRVEQVSWKEHPEFYTTEWVIEMFKNLGNKGWLQEIEAEFLD